MTWQLLVDTRVAVVDKSHKSRFRRFFQMVERSLALFQEVRS
jgi:hypothetical protein